MTILDLLVVVSALLAAFLIIIGEFACAGAVGAGGIGLAIIALNLKRTTKE
jgi:ABC-type methionine transport system permease subunit